MNDSVPDFLKEDQAEEAKKAPDLSTLMPLVVLFKEQKDEVDTLTEKLAVATKALLSTSRDKIPEIMNYIGYKEIKLATDEKLKVKEGANISVPDGKEALFFAFLKERNEQDIIKLQFNFPRMPTERRQMIFDFLEANEFEYEFKEGVHPKTLESYFKKLLGIGEEDREEGIQSGKYLHPDKVADFATIFTYYITTITAPKGKNAL